MSVKDTCEVLEIGLRAEGVHVLGIRLVNNNVFLVEFVAKSRGSVDVKAEIGSAISFVSSFFRDNPIAPTGIAFFAAQAFTDEKKSLMHAISSVDAAEHMSKGRSIEWLQNTIFQDHTEEYRQGIAKRRIAELENGLRILICKVLARVESVDWWNLRVGSKVRQATEDMYERQEGVHCDQGETLIHFTFLLDLRKIVVSNWNEFNHVFTDQKRFSDLLEELNVIRRVEAHNRALNDQYLKKLETIYDELMRQIANVEPSAANDFLVDNWRTRLREIFSAANEDQVVVQPGSTADVALKAVRKQVDRYEDLELRVASIVVPPEKRSLHDELLTLLGNVRSSLAEMVDLAARMDVQGLSAAEARNQQANVALSNFREKYLLSEL